VLSQSVISVGGVSVTSSTVGRLLQVRCPRCNRLACEATPGSRVTVKCGRCGGMFDWEGT